MFDKSKMGKGGEHSAAIVGISVGKPDGKSNPHAMGHAMMRRMMDCMKDDDHAGASDAMHDMIEHHMSMKHGAMPMKDEPGADMPPE